MDTNSLEVSVSAKLSEKHQRKLAGALFLLTLSATALFLVQTLGAIKGLRFIGSGVTPASVITVSGEGEVFAIPDIATFTFGVTKEAATTAEAQRTVTEKIDAALAFLSKNDIEERDITTQSYTISPRYEFRSRPCVGFACPPSGERELVGYQVSQNIFVKVRDTERAGTLLGGLGEIGVSTISGISFSIDDEDALVRQARAQAIENAQEEARLLARDLGVSLVRIVSYSEGGGGFPQYARALAFDEAGAGVAPVPDIPVGETKITSNVNVTYEIR